MGIPGSHRQEHAWCVPGAGRRLAGWSRAGKGRSHCGGGRGVSIGGRGPFILGELGWGKALEASEK